jgi:enoyl-CoA hydratase/carnithine racemase
VAGLTQALDTYGTMKLADVMQPAIDLAENGFLIPWDLAEILKARQAKLSEHPDARKIFYKANGVPYEPGERLKQPELAKTLKTIAKHVPATFYNGTIASLIAKELKKSEIGINEFLSFMRNLPVPTVASVHGAVLGGGFELALCCDMIVAAKSARIGAIEVTLGLMPIMGAVQRLVERAGVARAKELAMLGRRHDPEALVAMNIINLVVDERELYSTSVNLGQQLANGPTVALRAIKTLADKAANNGIVGADEVMGGLVKEVMGSEDLKRGLTAFQSSGPGTAVFEGN